MDLIRIEKQGLYCAPGDFFIDPWRPVKNAVITHVHADHARPGNDHYTCCNASIPLMDRRLRVTAKGYPFGEKFRMGDTWVSFHSAGHILGSAQVRVEHKGEVWVASGDYKRGADPSCDPFEVVPCDTFISEATFAVPIYNWESGELTAKKIFEWWHSDLERPSLLFCYALGKAQRILAELLKFTNRTVFVHGAVESLNEIYRDQNIPILPTKLVTDMPKDYNFAGDLILAPPSAHRSTWMKRFKAPQTGFASGWMQLRGARRRRGYEKGFVLSDHADWNDLIKTIEETGARRVFLTHGNTDILEKYLTQKNYQVCLFKTEFADPEEQA